MDASTPIDFVDVVCTLSIQDAVSPRLLTCHLNLYHHSCPNRGIISKRCSIRFLLLNKSLHILLPPKISRCDLINFLIRVIHHLTKSQPDKPSKFKPAKSGAPPATGMVTVYCFHNRVAFMYSVLITCSSVWSPSTSILFHPWIRQTKAPPTCFCSFARSFKQ